MALIDRDALIEEFRNMEGYYALGEGQEPLAVKDIVDVIKDADSVDAVPVVHGKWIPYYGGQNYKCSVCNEISYLSLKNGKPSARYCPNCGAKMTEGMTDEN